MKVCQSKVEARESQSGRTRSQSTQICFIYEVVQWYSFTHQLLSGVEFEDEKIVVANSVLDVKPGYQWRSFSMGLHAPMVFFVWVL